jgi:hypothetical protein
MADVKPLQISASAIRKLTPGEAAQFKSILDRANTPPKPTPAQIEENKPYAQIVKDGKVVGTVFKGGAAETSNAVGAQLRDFFMNNDNRDDRANEIARATGGIVRYV